MERICPCCKRDLEFSSTEPSSTWGEASGAPKGAQDNSFCVQASSKEEALSIIANFSGMTKRLGHRNSWRAGTLRWSAWAIVVSDGGVYVQGDLGPLYHRGNGGNLVPC